MPRLSHFIFYVSPDNLSRTLSSTQRVYVNESMLLKSLQDNSTGRIHIYIIDFLGEFVTVGTSYL
jgi:hypothetical protein